MGASSLAMRTKSDGLNKSLEYLKRPGRLERRLAKLDEGKAINRIFLMGCGRSGTWLLTAMMGSFADTAVVAKELPVEYFGIVKRDTGNLVLKRVWDSYEGVASIPERINILQIVRHPFAVLTSFNPFGRRKYHISIERWLGEMAALRSLIDHRRPNFQVVRYEDLVTAAPDVQGDIARKFNLVPMMSPEEAVTSFTAPTEASTAMHGVRPIDGASLQKYREDVDKIAYLTSIRSDLGNTLDWVSDRFDYDLTLPDYGIFPDTL